VHNFFIFDQMPTGLYFFAFLALALVASNVTGAGGTAQGGSGKKAGPGSGEIEAPGFGWGGWLAAALAVGMVAAAVWYVMGLAQSDMAIKRAFASSAVADFDALVSHGERATRGPNPTGAYDFLFARALALYVDATARNTRTSNQLNPNGVVPSATRTRAIEMGIEHAERSLAHTLTPESNYVLLAYLALAGHDADRLRSFASEALRWDSNFYNARWLMAESRLADGDQPGAVAEAELAIQLSPSSVEARSALARARGDAKSPETRIRGLVERAQTLANNGNTKKAQRLILRAIRNSNGPCPICHRALALVYEKAHRYEEAIAEWQAYSREAPDSAAAEQTSSHMEALRRKIAAGD
jgi:tetratricopeptide (TPR) repeat protein